MKCDRQNPRKSGEIREARQHVGRIVSKTTRPSPMRNSLSMLALLSALALPAAAHAATFNFTATGSGGGFSGSGSFVATAGSGGSFTINSISGPGITGLVAPGGFDSNDNLLLPRNLHAGADAGTGLRLSTFRATPALPSISSQPEPAHTTRIFWTATVLAPRCQ